MKTIMSVKQDAIVNTANWEKEITLQDELRLVGADWEVKYCCAEKLQNLGIVHEKNNRKEIQAKASSYLLTDLLSGDLLYVAPEREKELKIEAIIAAKKGQVMAALLYLAAANKVEYEADYEASLNEDEAQEDDAEEDMFEDFGLEESSGVDSELDENDFWAYECRMCDGIGCDLFNNWVEVIREINFLKERYACPRNYF